MSKGAAIRMSKNRQITIVDIAEAAGVSIATVSNVLNRRSVPMSEETIRKVEEAAERLGYRRNVMAASLSRRKSYELGLLVPSFGGYYGQFAEMMQRSAHQYGYHLSVFSSGGFDPEIEKRHLEVLLQRRVDGLVSHGLAMTQEATRQLVGEGTPLVLFNGWGWPPDLAIAAVNLDFAQGAREAVHHLYAQGCRRIVYLARSRSHSIDAQRRIGFGQAAGELAGAVRTEAIDLSSDEGERGAIERVMALVKEETPIGVLVFDDFSALSFMSQLLREGVRVPEDVKVIGINDDPISKRCYPALSTVMIPYELQARLAIDLMLRHLGEAGKLKPFTPEEQADFASDGGHEVRLRLKLVPRRSTEV